jgi:5-formyltetrahydrofolate cyclo-ligase
VQSISPAEKKRALRVHMLEQRGMLAPEEAARRSLGVQGHVLASSRWAEAGTVVLYMPVRREVDTGLLRSQAKAEGKRVLLPRCIAGQRGELELVPCKDATELALGAYGILEPVPSLPAIDLDDSGQAPHLLLAPCLAVDSRGFRLGYGGGYYDRLLSRPALQATLCIALIHALQFVPALPAESWDVRLHGVCTEEGLLWL